LSIASCGLPTKLAPRSVRAASKSCGVIGGQPRSRPIRSIVVLNGKNDSSMACSAVSAM
jgi:hypothetical protein